VLKNLTQVPHITRCYLQYEDTAVGECKCEYSPLLGNSFYRVLIRRAMCFTRSRSLKMAPFDRSYMTFYWSAIVSIAVFCTIFKLFDVE